MRNYRILLDPSGGLYLNERLQEWRFQRRPVFGHKTDLITGEIAAMLFDLLRTVGIDAMSTRCLRRTKQETGRSMQPLYHEGAGQYLRYCRLRPELCAVAGAESPPEWVWNEGTTALERDAQARLNFCRFIKADFMVTINVSQELEDAGLAVTHNGIGAAGALGEVVLKEVAKRSRRKISGTILADARACASHIVLDCGSTQDPYTARQLSQPWYRTAVAHGLFAALWKQLLEPRRVTLGGT